MLPLVMLDPLVLARSLPLIRPGTEQPFDLCGCHSSQLVALVGREVEQFGAISRRLDSVLGDTHALHAPGDYLRFPDWQDRCRDHRAAANVRG